jgi:poly-gamma-glutamate capsule biosynthesis protein CapA/YwtB (metallophosphatase superfamily)
MYLPLLSVATGALLELKLVPFKVRKFRLNRAEPEDVAWLRTPLDSESRIFGTSVAAENDLILSVSW